MSLSVILLQIWILGATPAQAISIEDLLSLEPTDSSVEVAPEELGSAPLGSDLTYVNPRASLHTCGAPLTLEEKLAQQRLEQFSQFMKKQGVAPPPKVTAFGFTLMSPDDVGHAEMAAKHPWIIGNYSSLAMIRDLAWSLEKFYFSPEEYTRLSDEADAFRHYAFTLLLVMRFGEERAKIVLDGHESYQLQVDNLMDLYNNFQTLKIAGSEAERLKKLSSLSQSQKLFEGYQAALKARKLVVLKPHRTDTPQPTSDFYRWAHRKLKRPL